MIRLSALDAVEWLAFNPDQYHDEAVEARFRRLCIDAPAYDLAAAQVVLLSVQAIERKRQASA